MAIQRRTGVANPRSQTIKKGIMKRVRLLYVMFAIVAIAIFSMLLITQWGPNGTPLRNRSDYKCYRTIPVPASRGNIYARDGRIMTTDSPSYEITLDFTVLDLEDEEFDRQALALADSLGKIIPAYSKGYFLKRLREIKAVADKGGAGSMNQRLMPQKVNQLQLDRMKNFPILNRGRLGGGLIFSQDRERYRPYGTLAARTLGRPAVLKPAGNNPSDTIETEGFGLEHSFNWALAGKSGRSRCVRLVRDIWVPVVDKENVEPKNGKDIVTTIDVNIQDIVESELRKQLLTHNAADGTAVVMDVASGEIRAVSNLSRYGGIVRDDVNHAITMRTEPGSTFKLVSLMALIEEAGYDINMEVDCTSDGKYYFQPRSRGRKFLVKDSHPIGKTTIMGVMAHSSNIGFVKLIDGEYRSKPERFVDFINGLGINRPIDMQLEGGRAPIIKDPRKKKESGWDELSLMKMAYGYAIELTPIHTLMLYNAIANGGRMVAPRIVTAVTENGRTVERFDKEVLNPKICSEKTRNIIHEALKEVVLHGTGSVLRDKSYQAVGKTGTAQINIPGTGYADRWGGRYYLATFVGYFPADKPKYSCIVAIRTYNGPDAHNQYYGAALALPAFKGIVDRIYALDGNWLAEVPHRSVADNISVKGGNLQQIYEAAGELDVKTNLGWRSKGWGVARPDSVKVEVTAIDTVQGTMPAVTGMGLKDALYLLEKQGIAVRFSGKGRVVSQSVRAGESIRRGSSVVLTLR